MLSGKELETHTGECKVRETDDPEQIVSDIGLKVAHMR